jgi:hypothetical protein
MTELERILGTDDEDVTNFRAGIGGLAFSGFSDEQIAAFAVEEAKAYRSELNDKLARAGAPPAFPSSQ